MMGPVLITGGAGFIGCSLAHRLVATGREVTVLDNLHPQVHTARGLPPRLPRGCRFLAGDVTIAENWATVLKVVQPDTIVHLAAETGTGQSLEQASRHGLVNVVGTTRLTDALTESGWLPRHIVLTSSRAVYGEGAWEDAEGVRFYPTMRSHAMLAAGQWDPMTIGGTPASPLASSAADTEARPANIYAATKLAQEHVLSAWTMALDVPLSILRLQNVYGPGQSLTNPYTGVLALFSRLATQGRPIEIYEDGEIIRDFVYVEDVTAALAAAIDHRPARQRIVDIGAGEPVTIREAATVLADLAGGPPPVITGKFRDGDVRAAWCNVEPAKRDLGYDPTWKFNEGARVLLEWVASELSG